MKKICSLLIFIFLIIIKSYSNQYLENVISGPLNYQPQPFDVLHYDAQLDFTKAPSTSMSGSCMITVLWTDNPDSNKFFFHLRDLTIDSIFYESVPIVAEVKGSKSSAVYHWEITPPKNTRKDTVKIQIYYHGSMTSEPGTSSWGGVFNQDSVLFSMGVGFMNNYVSATQHWLPCYDLPSDKATFHVKFKVSAGKTVAASGRLVGVEHINNTDIFEFSHDYPCATYLFCFAVADYQKIMIQDTNPPVVVYTLAKDSLASKYGYHLVPEMVACFEDRFIKFPFEKVGYVNTPIGSMEHQTMISFDVRHLRNVFQYKDSLNMIAAHELAHQWFGDYVTCRDFRDAWLSEGFATFLESLWNEKKKGFVDGYLQHQSDKINNYISRDMSYEGIMPLYNYPRISPSSNYPSTIYNKGCGVLGMLRYELGDSIFFSAMKGYLNKYAYGNVTSDFFKKSFEEQTGRNLDWFFNQWVYGVGLPQLNISVIKTPYPGSEFFKITINVTQVQPDSFGVYTKLPVPLTFVHAGSLYTHKILMLDGKSQEYQFDSIPKYITINRNQCPEVRSLIDIQQMTTTDVESIGKNNIDLEINPNPADTNIKLLFNSQNNCSISLSLIDIKGIILSKDTVNATQGENRYSLDLSNYSNGVYFIQIDNQNSSITKEIVIMH